MQGLYQHTAFCCETSLGRTECSIQQWFLFGSFHTEGSRESQHRPAVCLLLSTCTGASASCSCLFSFAVKASLVQTNTATDYRKEVSRESLLELLWCFWLIRGQGMFLADRLTNWVGCLACSWPKCPQDVTVQWVMFNSVDICYCVFKYRH